VRTVERIEQRGTAALKTLAELAQALGVTSDALRPQASDGGASRGVFQLPASLPDFTGREDELKRITERLQGSRSVGLSSALRGMGGVGKTVTAVEACWLVKDDFPDGQLVVELRGQSEQPLTPMQAMAQVIRDFHPTAGQLSDDANQLQALYRQVLEGKKALVLLDDARDEAQVRPLVGVPGIAFVITSRSALALDGVASIPLGVLPEGEAFALLRGLLGTKGTDDEVKRVAELCGHLPLALRVAGDFLRLHDNWPLPKYIGRLRDEAKRLEQLKGKSPDRDVEAVLATSARELVRENAERAERWQLLAVFPSDFDALAAAAVWDLKNGDKLDTDTADDELTALLDRSLVQYDADTSRYSLHDLMRPIARAAFDFVDDHPLQAGSADRIATAEQRFAVWYCRVLSAAADLYLKGNDGILQGLALFDREEANIRRGQAWAVQHRAANRTAAELCRDYPNAGVYVISLRLSAREQIEWLNESLTACREIGDRRGEGAALGTLGLAWADLGDARKAIGFYEQRLVIAREIGDRRGEGNASINLALARHGLGEHEEAIRLAEHALAIFTAIESPRAERVRKKLAEWRGEAPGAATGTTGA
jgi:tetratricopeptide (TPR) repeat protein